MHLLIYFGVGIVLAFALNSRREWLGAMPATPDDDGTETLFWFWICCCMWLVMLAAALGARVRKNPHSGC